MGEHRTEPHGWPVETDTYSAPCTATGNVGVSFKHGGSVTACIADGWEREDTHLTAEEARDYAELLTKAADILEAFQRGDYTPPESTYEELEPSPMMKAWASAYLANMKSMLEPRPSGSFWMSASVRDGETWEERWKRLKVAKNGDEDA